MGDRPNWRLRLQFGMVPHFFGQHKNCFFGRHLKPISRNEKLFQYKLWLVLAFVLIKLCSTVNVKFDKGKAYIASFKLL